MSTLNRADYVSFYGPSTGDRIRLGDTNLIIAVTKDLLHHGEETKIGWGGTVRTGNGQMVRNATSTLPPIETVIVNAVIFDYLDIYKADIGIANGRIVQIGRAGNPEISKEANIHINPSTIVIDAAGKIVTPGAVDSFHQLTGAKSIESAICSGVTTIACSHLSGLHTNLSSGTLLGLPHLSIASNLIRQFPINFILMAKGNSSNTDFLQEASGHAAGAFILHDDWGSTKSAIDACLLACEKLNMQCFLQTDTINERGYVQDSIDALKDRSVVALRSGGGGAGHMPDALKMCGVDHVLPSTAAATAGFSTHSGMQHRTLLGLTRGLTPTTIRADADFLDFAVSSSLIAAEQILHDFGAIPIITSSGGSLGRSAELIRRTWQMADHLKLQRGTLEGDSHNDDNLRAMRYIAKYTINPAMACGIDQDVGSIEPGKRADFAIWDPAFFGVNPAAVLVGGIVVASPSGDGNAAAAGAQPMIYEVLRGQGHIGLQFVNRDYHSTNNKNYLAPCVNTRAIKRADMPHNTRVPMMEIDAETLAVRADGQLLTLEPASSFALAQRYSFY